MDANNLPIACNLTAPELQERRSAVLQKVKAAAVSSTELENGYTYVFPSNESLLGDLTDLIQFEHKCCPFLRIGLTIEPGDGQILLELSGPPGTKAFLNSIFLED